MIAPCFAFKRLYSGTIRNDEGALVRSPNNARTDDTTGGNCLLRPCSGSTSGRYMLPSELTAELQAATPGQWIVMSTYKLVVGVQLKGERRWDCSAADARKEGAGGFGPGGGMFGATPIPLASFVEKRAASVLDQLLSLIHI